MTEINSITDQSDQAEMDKDDLPSIALQTLIFHVTGLCNLRCRHCWQSADLYDRLYQKDEKFGIVSPTDFSDVLKTLKDIGLVNVKFTGGEPFLHPRMIDYLEIADREKMSVFIETNGTLIEDGHFNKLIEIKKLLVAIGLDSPTARHHDHFRGIEGAYDKAIAAIERITRLKIPVQIIMSLHRENVNSLADMVKLAGDYGVQSLKINPVQPIGRGQELTRQGNALLVAELLRLGVYCRERLSSDFKGELFFSLPMAFQPFREIQRQNFSLCRLFQMLGLMPNGDLAFCGIGNIARSMVIGNIYQDNLTDLWDKAPVLVELRKRLPQELKGVCSRCILKALCLGECRAQAFEETGDLMSSYWICQQAYEEGLFPESRLIPEIL